MKTRHAWGKKIYFTGVISEKAGLTDQLYQFRTLQKLGLSLGWDYLHTPLYETRCMDLMRLNSARFTRLPGLAGKLREKILIARRRHIIQSPRRNVHCFLGLNQYFSARNQTVGQQPQTEKWTTVDFPLLPSCFEKEHIHTLEDLKHHIKERVSAENDPAYPCLVRLSGGGIRIPFLNPIKTLTPNPTDEPDLPAIYFEHRRKHPRKSRFPRDGLKTLVHIRLGDVASVKTPWGT